MRKLTRRTFVAGGAMAGLLVAAPRAATAAGSATAAGDGALRLLADVGMLPIPPLLSPPLQAGARSFDLTLQTGRMEFEAGSPVETLGVNGPYLGPTLRASRGDDVTVTVTNRIGEPTTLHWHGMHLPAMMDGGPH